MNTHADGNLLLDVEWESCLLEPARNPEIETFAKRKMGMLPPGLAYVLHAPWLARAQIILSYEQGLLIHLDDELADLAAMAASLDNACRYCYAVGRLMMRMQGMSEAQVRKAERQLMDSAGSARQAATIQFTYRMSRSDPLMSQADNQALLEAGFSQAELKELAYVVAFLMFANRVNTIPAISPFELEAMPDRWMTKLMRPLILHSIKRHHSRGRPLSSPPAYSGPYAYMIEAYGDSPIAAALAQVLSEAWGETALTRRCKALLFAVVAKALGCDLSATEAGGMLIEAGLDTGDQQEILTHLRSTRLDAVEAVLVPFARQTVWYQPAQIQRQARQLLGSMSTEQFVDALGILSLANALCRLGAVVIEH